MMYNWTAIIVVYCVAMSLITFGMKFFPELPGEVDWDYMVRTYSNIRVRMEVSPDAHDRWHITVRATGRLKDVKDMDIQSWTLQSKRNQLDAEESARAFIDRIRVEVAAAQSRKMRSRSETVPL